MTHEVLRGSTLFQPFIASTRPHQLKYKNKRLDALQEGKAPGNRIDIEYMIWISQNGKNTIAKLEYLTACASSAPPQFAPTNSQNVNRPRFPICTTGKAGVDLQIPFAGRQS